MKRLTGHAHRLSTPSGSITARQVLLATGSPRSVPVLFPPAHRAGRRLSDRDRTLIVARLDSLLPHRRNAADTRNFVSYFRVTPDNRLLFGGRARFAKSNARSDVKSGAILRRSMIEIFPSLSDVAIDYCWGGMVDMTADRLPGPANMTACSIPWATVVTARRWRPIWARSCPRSWTAILPPIHGAISTGPPFPDISAPHGPAVRRSLLQVAGHFALMTGSDARSTRSGGMRRAKVDMAKSRQFYIGGHGSPPPRTRP